jgi:hypothetical protein
MTAQPSDPPKPSGEHTQAWSTVPANNEPLSSTAGTEQMLMVVEEQPGHEGQVITSDELYFQNFIRSVAAGRGHRNGIPDLLADQRLGKR